MAQDVQHASVSQQDEPSVVDDLPARRIRRPTARALAMLEDTFPEGPNPVEEIQSDDASTSSQTEPPPVDVVTHPEPLRIRIRRIFRSKKNAFGVYRMYHGKPSGVPVNASTRHHLFSDDFCALAANRSAAEEPQPQHSVSDIIDPYPNKSTFLFNDWFWTGANKSQSSRKDLLENVLRHPDFVLKDLPKTDAELRRLDQALAENPGSVASSSGWKVTDVDIMIPTGKKSTKTSRQQAAATCQRQRHVLPDLSSDEEPTTVAARIFTIRGFHHKSLTSLLVETFSSAEAANFHWHPFEERWERPWDKERPERIYSDICGSRAFQDADRELQASPPESGCQLPRAVAAFMFYSDATHVAQFGKAKLWPLYTMFGNQSKYDRGKSGVRGTHTAAFLPSVCFNSLPLHDLTILQLPDHIIDFVLEDPTGKLSDATLAHLRRELFHACWGHIFDDDFLYAYEHGIIVDCGDGVRRRLYPRIFIYSADYPEKYVKSPVVFETTTYSSTGFL